MVSIGAHYNIAAVTSMESYIASNPSATYPQIDLAAQSSASGLQPSFIPAINVWDHNLVGIGILAPNAKLDVWGSINSNGIPLTSDSTLKTNIHVLSNGALSKINSPRT